MNSTLCFLTVAFRMLSKAPWKSKWLLQFTCVRLYLRLLEALWVWSKKQGKYPLTRAELALAAASYKGCIKPQLPDDPAQAIFPMIDCLPTNIGCEDMFSQGKCFCPFCGNQNVFAVTNHLLTGMILQEGPNHPGTHSKRKKIGSHTEAQEVNYHFLEPTAKALK